MSLFLTPAISVNVPRLVLLSTIPEITDVPVLTILPEASGVPAIGRTLTFCQVKELVTPLLVAAVIVMDNCVMVADTEIVEPLGRSFILRVLLPLPPIRVTKTVGAVPPVSKINPVGAFNIMVPIPISAVAPSETTGPVNDV